MKTKAIFIGIIFLFLILPTQAQTTDSRWGFELSSGLSMATKKLSGAKLNPGLGFEGIFHYRFAQHTGVYAGWGWNRLGADNSFAGNDVCFEETGHVMGLQYKRALGSSPVSWYLRAGALYNHIETENADGDIINDTGHGWGWQLAGGIDLPLGKSWSLTPGVKFNSLTPETSFDGTPRQLDYRYLQVRVGIRKSF
jgi:hypothetical protein